MVEELYMSSDQPLLLESDLPSVIHHRHRKSGSRTCICSNASFSSASSTFDEPQQPQNSDLDLKDHRDVVLAKDCIFHSTLANSTSFGTEKDFHSVASQFSGQFPLECPTRVERTRRQSWGTMELHDANVNNNNRTVPFEISAASAAASSQRIRHKSVQFDDEALHEDSARLIYINDPKKTNDKYEFTGNEIRTSKYTIITFLPKNLFIQFHRVAYLYFLAIAALNQLPPLAVFGRTVSLFPLLFVLCVTAIKDGYEDWRRHRSDRNENNRESLVLQYGDFRSKKWKRIQAGEVVKIFADETIPADMVLLGDRKSVV